MNIPIIYYLTELLFPRLCVVCGDKLIEQEQWICLHCLHHIPRTNFHLESDNPVARLFYGRVQIEYATSFFYFSKGSKYQSLLHNLKYKGMKELGEEIGKHFGIDLMQSPEFSTVDVICPVPLHPQKERKRGYNQSWWIASGIARQMQKELSSDNLIRVTATETQTRKSRFARWQNVEGIFELSNPEAFSGKHVLLVDDVVTTGSTLEACASSILTKTDARISIATLATA
ncbi:MAG: phosphoribosyltransferase family protein [Bacteroidota bacterium]|nr:amidophosphoribosyltransferase [Odoribacter sp.]MDP3642611.1 phosphoribosyltransferase family protein [Bacteroidota bacterium]